MQIKLTPIIPRPLNVEVMKQQLINAMRDVGEEIRENFEDTTRTWNHKPVFEPPTNVPVVGVDFITVSITTTDQVYGWLNEGTRKNYLIEPVNAKRLHYKSEFIPKTTPGIIGSGVGFIGDTDHFRTQVIHPGIEARKWDKDIAERQQKNFNISLSRAMILAARASGHRFP